MKRIVVLIPTYNEKENLAEMVARVLAAVPAADVLVIDDASPDGTGEIADGLSARDERIHVLHRAGKLGLGSAYVEGFAWGLARGYDFLVEMDADGSHPPERLPIMLEAADTPTQTPEDRPVGLVIGSRWVAGGEVTNWPRRRSWLSRVANAYAGVVLGITVKDATAGFRVFRAAVLRELPLGAIDSKGYCFQVEMTLRVLDAGYQVLEVPINFHERRHGQSKMSGDIAIEAMWRITGWGWQRRVLRRLPRWSRRSDGPDDPGNPGDLTVPTP